MAGSDTSEQSDTKLQTDAKCGYSLRRSARLKTTVAKNSSAASKTGRPVKKRTISEEPQFDGEVIAEVADATAPPVNTDHAADEKNVYADVTETLRTFNKHYLHFIQAEEARCPKNKARKKQSMEMGSKSKKAGTAAVSGKKARPDLKAITEMKKTQAILYSEKICGSVPGIDVGHQFFARAEMVALGFHHHHLSGIDYIGITDKKSRQSLELGKYKLPVAVSIVVSGQYEDDVDKCEEIVYTGQGGNNLLGDKRQFHDQVLKRGNLALKNSMEQSVAIRVVRGHKNKESYVGKVYTYDGLYKVVEYWAEQGISEFNVYKFRLKRLEGQPPLKTKEVYFTRGRIPKSVSQKRGLVCKDITGGLEGIPIPVTNLVDDPAIPPAGFTYITKMEFNKNISFPTIAPVGCNCRGNCTDHRSCACAKLNGGDFPYVQRNGGRLVEAKAVVFECGPNCGCGSKCVNRTGQKGIKFRLEVFRTPTMGWGVRSFDHIPSGAPICEYIGHLMRTDELSSAVDNSYVIDIDCLQTMKGLKGRESRLRDVTLPLQKFCEETSESVPFCIDAGNTGNVARFINHSCQPNLFVQCMLSDHHDPRFARLMLIAADNVPPLKELTYDYAYELDTVIGVDGQIQQRPCLCGTDECRKRLY